MFRIRTFAEVLYSDFALDPDPARAALRLAPGVGLVALAVLGMLRLAAPWHAGPRSVIRRPAPPRRWPGSGRLAAGISGLIGMAVGLPLGSLIWKLGGVATLADGEWVRRWSPAHAAKILASTPWEFRVEFAWTFAIGGLTALAVTLVVPAIVWRLRNSPRGLAVVLSTGAFLAALPGPSFAIAVAALRLSSWWPSWLSEPLDLLAERSLAIVVFVLAVRAAPLCGAVAWQAWRTVPRELLDAAALDGLGPWRQFFAIAAPLRRRTLAAIGLLAWCLAAGDLTSTVLLAPARVSPVAVRTFQLIHAGVDDRLAGLCLASLAVFGILAAGFQLLTRKDRLWE